MKKIVEDLEDGKLIEPTHSYYAAPSRLVKKEIWQLQTSCRLQRFEQTNRENQFAATKNK